MNQKLDKLKKITRNSVFYKSPNYSVNVDFKRLFNGIGGILLYNEDVQKLVTDSSISSREVIRLMTPEFQRSNTKWTMTMQRQFVENLVCGCETKIQLYDIKGRGGELANSLILDGLQRLTSISAYQNGDFPIFDDLYWSDINHGGIFPRLRLIINIFQFDTDIEACIFYIQMNKGITHSESDLESAYRYIKDNS